MLVDEKARIQNQAVSFLSLESVSVVYLLKNGNGMGMKHRTEDRREVPVHLFQTPVQGSSWSR